MSMRNPPTSELELLEQMPVRAEYRDALRRVLDFVHSCAGHEHSSEDQTTTKRRVAELELVVWRHKEAELALRAENAALKTRRERDQRAAIESVKKQMRADIQLMAERHKTEERRLRAVIADLTELAFPPGTWVLAKGDARHARLKSLYCAWLARWTRYLDYIRASTREGIGTVRAWPNYAEQDRIADTVRALYDAAVRDAHETDSVGAGNSNQAMP